MCAISIALNQGSTGATMAVNMRVATSSAWLG
jgi:hypothetical protein